jgi:arylformamidase
MSGRIFRCVERIVISTGLLSVLLLTSGCSTQPQGYGGYIPVPTEIVDLGVLVTEDLPQLISPTRVTQHLGLSSWNEFKVSTWEFAQGAVSGQNSYLSFVNHFSGPHVDAPIHIGVGGGIDRFPVEAFAGPVKVIDVSGFPIGRSVTTNVFEGRNVQPGGVVLIYTAHTYPKKGEGNETTSLTHEAAEYLAMLPVRAFGTDASSVFAADQSEVLADTAIARAVPVHHAFLSRGIPIYEQLFNLDRLLDKKSMYFVGPPINVKGVDGMLARPYVLVY